MRKVYLDNLIRYENGKYKGKINWSMSVGHNISFVYDDICGYIDIIEYNKEKRTLKILYENNEFKITTECLYKGKLGSVLKTFTKDFKIKIGQTIKDNKRDLTITDREYRKNVLNNQNLKWYKYTCNKCGWTEGWIAENSLNRGRGCSCCCGRTTVYGINSIHDTAPWMIDLGVDYEEAKKFTSQSNKKIKCICPYCQLESYKSISDIYNNKSISCHNCGDAFSYLSKYIYSVLNQLNIKFDTEVKYGWNKYINPKNNKLTQASIDFVIYYNNREIPIEADGEFHRADNHLNGQTKEMSQCIDKQRDDNCLKYLGEETIRISDEGDLKENVLNSKLSELFDLSKVEWNKCEEYSLKNLVKEVCDYWNNKEEWKSSYDVANKFKTNPSTIVIYLKKGAILGWCNYDAKKEKLKTSSKNGKANGKKTSVYKDNKLLGIFESCTELERQSEEIFDTKLLSTATSEVCNGKRKQYKGYIFKYV